MKNTYQEKITTRDTDINFTSLVPVPVIMRLMQQVIYTHADNIGLDHANMIEKSNAFWIVSKIKICLKANIGANEKITVKTWTDEPGVLRFNRNCTIKSGNKLKVKSVSEWCCLDWSTRRPRKASTVNFPELEMSKDKPLNLTFTNMKMEVTEKDFVYSRKILSTDIDVNFHTNNLRYNYFAFDAFSVEELKTMEVLEYEIYFVNECKEGETLDIYRVKSKNYYYIEGKAQDKTIFRSVIKFKTQKR